MALRSRQGFIEAPGARIFYKTLGAGPPLLLLHGGPGADHTDFLPFLLPLARRHQLILIDERGSGRSERLQDKTLYTIDNMVADVEAVRKALQLRKLALLGHSFGGILAQAYAIAHPQRLTHLILAGTAASARTINAEFRRIRTGLSQATQDRLAELEELGIFRADGSYRHEYARLCARAYLPFMYVRSSPPIRPSEYVSGWAVMREMWVRRSDFRLDGNLKGFNFEQPLRSVKVPALVLAGDHDMISVRGAKRLADSLPRSQLTIMPRCGHMMFVDDPEVFNALLAIFLSPRTR